MVDDLSIDGILVVVGEFLRMERGREAVVTVVAKEVWNGVVGVTLPDRGLECLGVVECSGGAGQSPREGRVIGLYPVGRRLADGQRKVAPGWRIICIYSLEMCKGS